MTKGFMDGEGASSGASGAESYYSAAFDEGVGYFCVVLFPGNYVFVARAGSYGKVIGLS